jgi:hypothetical protein
MPLGGIGVGPDEQQAPVREESQARPDLLTRHHIVVPVPDRPGPQTGQVRARFGLGEALAPDNSAAHSLQVHPLLLGRTELEQCRRQMMQRDRVQPGIGSVRTGKLFLDNHLLAQAVAASPFAGQVRRSESARLKRREPVTVKLDPLRLASH